MYDFKTFGQMNLDIIFKDFPRMPVPGEEVFAKNFNMQLGGGSMLMPLVLDKLGCKVRLGTFMNDNTVSRVCRTLLAERGFDAYDCFDGINDNPVVVTSVFSWPEDRGFLAYNEFANEGALSTEAVYGYLKDASIVFAPCGHPEVIRQLSRDGVKVVFDTGWYDGLDIRNLTDVLSNVEICTPNDREALKMTGKSTVEEAIRMLADYTPHPVVTLGSRGCAYWTGSEVDYVPAVAEFREKAIDTTGAGDNFLSGVIYGMIKGQPMRTCLQYGNIFAGYSTTWIGCYGGIVTEELIQAYLKQTS